MASWSHMVERVEHLGQQQQEQPHSLSLLYNQLTIADRLFHAGQKWGSPRRQRTTVERLGQRAAGGILAGMIWATRAVALVLQLAVVLISFYRLPEFCVRSWRFWGLYRERMLRPRLKAAYEDFFEGECSRRRRMLVGESRLVQANDDVKFLILQLLDPISINRLSQTCRAMRAFSGDPDGSLWRQVFDREIIRKGIGQAMATTIRAGITEQSRRRAQPTVARSVVNLINETTANIDALSMHSVRYVNSRRSLFRSLPSIATDKLVPSSSPESPEHRQVGSNSNSSTGTNFKRLALDSYFAHSYAKLSPLEKDVFFRGYVTHVLPVESYESMLALPHVLLTPLKLFGYMTYPIYLFCQRRVRQNISFSANSSSTMSLLCLRFLIVDLSIQAKSLRDVWRIHLFGIVNLICALVLNVDFVATTIVWANWGLLTLLTALAPMWFRAGTRVGFRTKSVLYAIQIVAIPLFLLLQAQFFMLPYSLWSGRTVANFFGPHLSAAALGAIKSEILDMIPDAASATLAQLAAAVSADTLLLWRNLVFFFAQLFWIPVMCSVEDASYTGMQTYLGDAAPFWLVGRTFKTLTFAVQCFFGVSAYIAFLSFAVIHEFVRHYSGGTAVITPAM